MKYTKKINATLSLKYKTRSNGRIENNVVGAGIKLIPNIFQPSGRTTRVVQRDKLLLFCFHTHLNQTTDSTKCPFTMMSDTMCPCRRCSLASLTRGV